MKNVLVIGCGGIGSYLTKEINRLILNDQISLEEFEFTVSDFDIVELKNVKYQDYEAKDIFKNKANIISDRYCFNVIQKKIEFEAQLSKYDLILIAVDNSKARKLVFDFCNKNPNKEFIDLRAEGRAIAFFTSDKPYAEMLNTLDEKITEDGNSCQLKYELENGIIQNGNIIISAIGSQLLLNWCRKIPNISEFRMRF